MPQQGKTLELTLIPSASRTATITSAGDKLASQYDELLLALNVTVVASTGTVLVDYQVSFDDGTTWLTHSSMTISAGVSTRFLNVSKIGAMGRVLCTYGGAGAITFAVYAVYKKIG
jgi:hypothetical protein